MYLQQPYVKGLHGSPVELSANPDITFATPG